MFLAYRDGSLDFSSIYFLNTLFFWPS